MSSSNSGESSLNPLWQIIDRNIAFGLSQQLSLGDSGTNTSPYRNMTIYPDLCLSVKLILCF